MNVYNALYTIVCVQTVLMTHFHQLLAQHKLQVERWTQTLQLFLVTIK